MYRLSLIISEIYNKYLPLAEKDGIILNLDFSDTTKEISDPERVKKYLDEHLSSTLKRTDKGEVTIGVDKSSITITDSATTLSHAACALLSNRYIDVTSRVGFGTTVKIFFQPRELPSESTEKLKLEVEGVGISAMVDNSEQDAPALNSEVKVATKQGKKRLGFGAKLRLKGNKPGKTSTAKTAAKAAKTKTATKPKAKQLKTPAKRKLDAAARKADREVKRIAKKAQKAKKPIKATKSSSPKTAKPAKKVKRIKKIELS